MAMILMMMVVRMTMRMMMRYAGVRLLSANNSIEGIFGSCLGFILPILCQGARRHCEHVNIVMMTMLILMMMKM